MSKQFYFYFGSGNPATYTGLSPTFVIFNLNGITALPAPGVTEFFGAGATGIYGFQYGTTASILFKIDGGVTAGIFRYITDTIDPVMGLDSVVGYPTDSFGNTMTDPTTLFGKANRSQEWNEGDKVFTKATAVWDNYNRGSSVLLIEKVLTNTVSQATSTINP